ncbi:hypothetical protein PCA10_11950 [Metapseudomonas resinovorans NBRC 106553]|uniref:Uncharacterized protein n=1 Tax=Metapseudomonas resinovorans NBRC 106553 TaxID=1245471 RepID=S6AD32_METRE|nr:hypothetical protein PCA10_11950 [Pseudomonas resinovorans NBRC 106553]
MTPRKPPLQEAEWNPCAGDERHGCRESRAGPWMALRGGPRSKDGRRGPGAAGPDVGASVLLPLGRLPKGVAREGETETRSPLGSELSTSPKPPDFIRATAIASKARSYRFQRKQKGRAIARPLGNGRTHSP